MRRKCWLYKARCRRTAKDTPQQLPKYRFRSAGCTRHDAGAQRRTLHNGDACLTRCVHLEIIAPSQEREKQQTKFGSATSVDNKHGSTRNDLRQECARTTNQRLQVLVATRRSLGHACGHSDGNSCRGSKRICRSSSYDIFCDRGGTRRNTSCSSKVSS